MDKLEKALEDARRAAPGAALAAWDRLARPTLDPRHLAQTRIVAQDKRGKLHAPFDMLRARILRRMRANGWRSIAITSPTPGCGKTTVALNLGFSLARRIDGRVLGEVRSRPDARGLLVLSEKGCIEGSAKVHDAVINGTIKGDLEGETFLELQPGARVTGNISYRKLRMECGAFVDGRLQCLGEAVAERNGSDNVVTLPRAQSAEG